MEIILESMMVAERGEFLAKNPGNKGNYDVSQLFAWNTGHDIYHQLDREAQPRLPKGDPDENCHAQRGIRADSDG